MPNGMHGHMSMSFEEEVLDRLERLEMNQGLTMNALQALCEKAGLEERVATIAAQLRMQELQREVDREQDREHDTDPVPPTDRNGGGE